MQHFQDYSRSASTIVSAFQGVLGRKSLAGALDERHILAEALFLRLVTNAEVAADRLFWSIMVGECFINNDVRLLQAANSLQTAKALYMHGKYMDWLPISDVPAKTNKYFRAVNPFDRLSVSMKNPCSEVHAIRNFIAHRSEVSLQKLIFIPAALRPTVPEESVARHLLANTTGSPSNFEVYAEALEQWIYSCCRR